MANYIVNRTAQYGSGDHEVHNLDANCSHLPSRENQLALGEHSTCSSAVQAARRYYSDVNGCYYCAYACHTT